MPGLPSFKNFLQGLKDDLKGTIMYVAFIIISVLFGILQSVSNKNSIRQDKELIECRASASANAVVCKTENDQMRGQIVQLMGDFKELKGEINTLKKLGIIKE